MPDKAMLLVDDEALILLALKREISQQFGGEYRIETALNGEEGLEVISDLADEGIAIILIISDWLMPGMKGDEFLIRVKQKYPDILTFMITGQADGQAIDRARNEAGLFACFGKPWPKAELISSIEEALKDGTRPAATS